MSSSAFSRSRNSFTGFFGSLKKDDGVPAPDEGLWSIRSSKDQFSKIEMGIGETTKPQSSGLFRALSEEDDSSSEENENKNSNYSTKVYCTICDSWGAMCGHHT